MPSVNPVNQRLKDLMEALGYKKIDPFVKYYFGQDARSERLRSAINGDSGIKTDFLVEITEKIFEVDRKRVNGHWLLSGEGEMFLDENEKAAPKQGAAVGRELEEILKDLDAFRTLAIQNAQTILNLSAGGGRKATQEA